MLRGLVAITIAAASAIARDAATGKPRPNFVIILVDDLGWADLGCTGSRYHETPNLDRLASQGIRFTDAYAACAVCSPTRAALLTGRYPARIGITDWIRARFQRGEPPAPGSEAPPYVAEKGRALLCPRNPLWMELAEVTIAEELKPLGYLSCHIGKWHLGLEGWYPEDQGFDRNIGGCDFGQPPSYFDPYERKGQGRIPTLPARREGEYLTDREADEAIAFIRAHRDRPFFLHMAHYAVHTPLEAKPEVVERYRRKTATNQKHPVYAAMVEGVDRAAGRILGALDELGLTERTIVIFTSDNGGLLGPTDNAPLRGGKGMPYEGGIRVPLIVRWPGVVRPGSISRTPVSTIDLFPTILAAAGVPLPADRPIDGVDLRPILAEKGAIDRDVLFWHFPHYRGEIVPYSIVRAGPWKLIVRYEGKRFELYDLSADIGETRDLAPEMPEKVDELHARLSAWLAAVGAKMPRPAAEEAPLPTPPAKRARRLGPMPRDLAPPALEGPFIRPAEASDAIPRFGIRIGIWPGGGPRGISYENFELEESLRVGVESWFGVTLDPPETLGFDPKLRASPIGTP